MLRRKSLNQQELMRLARSKGKSKAKNSLRSIINDKTLKLRNNQSLTDISNFKSQSKSQSNRKAVFSQKKTHSKPQIKAQRRTVEFQNYQNQQAIHQNKPKVKYNGHNVFQVVELQLESREQNKFHGKIQIKLQDTQSKQESQTKKIQAEPKQSTFKENENIENIKQTFTHTTHRIQKQDSLQNVQTQSNHMNGKQTSRKQIKRKQISRKEKPEKGQNTQTHCQIVQKRNIQNFNNNAHVRIQTCSFEDMKASVFNQQIGVLKQYIAYLEQQNHSLERQLNQEKCLNCQLAQELDLARSQIESKLTYETEKTFQNKMEQGQPFQIKKKQGQPSQWFSPDPYEKDKISTVDIEAVQKIKQFDALKTILGEQRQSGNLLACLSKFQLGRSNSKYAQQQTEQIAGFFEEQIRLLKQQLKAKEIEYLSKQQQFKSLLGNSKSLLNAKSRMNDLMRQFKSEQNEKRNIFTVQLHEDRKTNGISALFS